MITLSLAPASLPPGQRVYAVGDVHGCSDRLGALHRAIADDLAARPVAAPLVIHLGDYVDRGPDSAGVIERLLQPFPQVGEGPGPLVVNLMGNHEEMMLTGLADGDLAVHWLANGGDASLESWGVSLRTRARDMGCRHPATPSRVHARAAAHACRRRLRVRARRPAAERAAGAPVAARYAVDLRTLPLLHRRTARRGGARPYPGRRAGGPPNRIGIDTGAFMGGPLTCLVLEEDRFGFISG